MEEKKRETITSRVLVIGGGLGGIRTAVDLAEAERTVLLVDRARTIGGLMTQLDRTFPTNNCDLCTLAPYLSEGSHRKRIEILTMSTVIDITGEKGHFNATIQTAPRYINQDKCTGCGICYEAFPDCVHFDPGLDHRAPTCMRYPQATPQAFSIDPAACHDIEALVNVCPAGAIVPDDSGRHCQISCGAVVMSPGAALFEPTGLDYLGYDAFPDVVTSLEYERLLSASGPTTGQLVRPSNGRPPEKIAWIQCIGSRGIQKGAAASCSSACCMFALKEAIITKERFRQDIETTIFYMDMRTFGKDYEHYLARARDEFGVRLIRSRPHSITQAEGEEGLILDYTSETCTEKMTEPFDMVVLATGFRIDRETAVLAEKIGIELNEDNYPVTAPFNAVATSRPGVYVAGTFQEPKDIPETMVQASAAACMAVRDTAPAAADDTEIVSLPPERNVAGEEPKIGVFIGDCGEDNGKGIDGEQLVAYARTLNGVIHAASVEQGCTRVLMEAIRQAIDEQGLNRLVIGGGSPRVSETAFQELMRQAGLNKYLVEIANIRDQAAWVHGHQPDQALQKAKELIAMAVGSVARARPLVDKRLPVIKEALVVGGGVAGMTAALELAGQGFRVYLVEKTAELGGVARFLKQTLEKHDVQSFISDLVYRTRTEKRIEIITAASIVDHSGMVGMFKTEIVNDNKPARRQIVHGVTIIATGARPNRPAHYLLGSSERVMTQLELQERAFARPKEVAAWDNVVMIQCVGSRTGDNPNCSRICCQAAIKNAIKILEINPEARVFVLYRDIRTYGFQEKYYQKARELGAVFIRYTVDVPPEVTEVNGRIDVSFIDPIMNREVTVSADSLVLSTGLIADSSTNKAWSSIFKLPLTDDNYLQEDHVKLRPIDLPVPGFFVAGTAHAPKTITESVTQARAAASRAIAILTKDSITVGAAVAQVDGSICASCLICVRACPFGIPFINADGYSEIDPAQCHGCGVCVAECPAKAIQLMQFEDDRILAKLEELFERTVA
ncbi:MAG: heterodisulfide reductase subunit A [Desulfobacterales bacterium]|nr:MAG: heterodisulfide reductase subunit A [Desulfobacterales bacterium]